MRVALHIADAALVLALGSRPIRRAGPRPEIPVPGKRQEPRVEPHLPRATGRGTPPAPARCPPARPAAPRQNGGTPLPAQRTTPIAVHGGRPARTAAANSPVSPRTETPAPQCRRSAHASGQSRSATACPAASRTAASPAPAPPVPAGMGQPRAPACAATPDPAFPLQVLAHHVGIAPVADQPLPQPRRLSGQLPRPGAAPAAVPLTRRHIPLHRGPAAPQRSRYPARPPAKIAQPKHRCHILRRLHRLPPRLSQPRQGRRFLRQLHPSPPQKGGPDFNGATGPVFPVARHPDHCGGVRRARGSDRTACPGKA